MAPYSRTVLACFEEHIHIDIEGGEIACDSDPVVTAVILLGAKAILQRSGKF